MYQSEMSLPMSAKVSDIQNIANFNFSILTEINV